MTSKMMKLSFSGVNVKVTFPDGRVVTSDGIEDKDLVAKRFPSTANLSCAHDEKWLSARNVIRAAWQVAFSRRDKIKKITTSDCFEIAVQTWTFLCALNFNTAPKLTMLDRISKVKCRSRRFDETIEHNILLSKMAKQRPHLRCVISNY